MSPKLSAKPSLLYAFETKETAVKKKERYPLSPCPTTTWTHACLPAPHVPPSSRLQRSARPRECVVALFPSSEKEEVVLEAPLNG